MFLCDKCEEYFDEPRRTAYNTVPYSDGCAHEYGSVCPECGSEEIVEVFPCANCHNYFEEDELETVIDGEIFRRLCPECLDEEYPACENCGKRVPTGELTECNGDMVCSGCLGRRYPSERRVHPVFEDCFRQFGFVG